MSQDKDVVMKDKKPEKDGKDKDKKEGDGKAQEEKKEDKTPPLSPRDQTLKGLPF